MLALLFLSNAAEERIESLDPLQRIVPESFLIAGRQNVRHDSRRAAFEIAFPLATAGNRLQVRRLELYGINCRTQFTKNG
jgi:hypothetical protein